MRVFCSIVGGCIAATIALAVPLFSRSDLTLPGCEPPTELRKALEEKLKWQDLQKLKYAERMARTREVLDDLIAKYPREAEPHRRLIDSVRWKEPEQLPALQERYRKQAAENPEDPLALYLAGFAFLHTNSPESLRLFEAAKAKAPQFPWPALGLVELYSGGKLADKKKAAENISAFFTVCSASTDSQAQGWLAKAGDAALLEKVAAALRTRLTQERDPARLKDFGTLWGLEFRTRPPKEHDALRKQIAEDLKRLEALNPKPDAEWLAFLLDGYKQADQSKETVTAAEDRLLREYPKSEEAFSVVSERWLKDHKEPEDQKDTAAWAKYWEAWRQSLHVWLKDYPDNLDLTGYSRFFGTVNDTTVPEAEGVAAMEAYVTAITEYDQPSAFGHIYAADFLLRHQWRPERALALLHMAGPLVGKREDYALNDDLLSDDVRKMWDESKVSGGQGFAGSILKAAMMLGRPAEAESVRALVEVPPPTQKKFESDYWRNRARLAKLEGRKIDALAYYQLALHTRLESPKPYQGVLRDDITDEAQALWKDLGGTEAAWDLWRKAAGEQLQQLSEGRWEKPTKELPNFELADLSGQTWSLKNLKGKSVLINVWSSW